MGSVTRYYSAWVRAAFCHSIGITDLYSGFAGSVLAVIDHYEPQAGLMASYGWQIPLWAAAAVVIVRLLLAPYWMWRDGQPLPIHSLKLSFDDTCKVFTAPGHGIPADSCFIRLIVENISERTAEKVVAKLIDLKRIEGGNAVNTAYVDQLPLKWSNIGPARIAVTKDERPHVDVAMAKANALVPQTVPADKVRIVDPGVYRFTVQLFGTNVRSEPRAIDVIWHGYWADVDVGQ